jgi:hypothetical protein
VLSRDGSSQRRSVPRERRLSLLVSEGGVLSSVRWRACRLSCGRNPWLRA